MTGAYVLPKREDCLEAFMWLAQEIQSAKGEALVMEVERFTSLSDKDLVARFHAARAEAYQDLASELEHFEASLSKKKTLTAVKALDKLRKRFSDIRRADFFDSPAGKDLMAHLRKLEQQLLPQPPESAVTKVNRADYMGKTWVTRPQPHVDRLASAWLIKRFIDTDAVIVYRKKAKPGEISFDMDGAMFGHVAQVCSFETLLVAFALEDEALEPIAQIVHEIDLRDERYARAEIAGIDALLEGWAALKLSDEELEQRGRELFEGLYQRFSNS